MKDKFLRFTAVFMLVVCVFCLSGCSEDKQARRALDGMFAELKKGDYDAAREYISQRESTNDFLGAADKFNQKDFPAYEMHKEFFKSIDYKVKKVDKENSVKIKYTVEIEALDLNPIAETLFEISEQYNNNIAMENEELKNDEESDVQIRSEEEMQKEISKILTQHMVDISSAYINSDEKKTQKTTVDIYVCYEEDKVWRVYPDEALINALTGGVYGKYNQIVNEYIELNK